MSTNERFTVTITAANGDPVFIGSLPPDCITIHRERNGVTYAMLSRIPTPIHDMLSQLANAQHQR